MPQVRTLDEVSFNRQEREDRFEVHSGVLGAESLADALLLVEDAGG